MQIDLPAALCDRAASLGAKNKSKKTKQSAAVSHIAPKRCRSTVSELLSQHHVKNHLKESCMLRLRALPCKKKNWRAAAFSAGGLNKGAQRILTWRKHSW